GRGRVRRVPEENLAGGDRGGAESGPGERGHRDPARQSAVPRKNFPDLQGVRKRSALEAASPENPGAGAVNRPPFIRVVDALLERFIAFLMAALVVCVLWQVFTRYALRDPSAYTEELARFLLIWLS